MPALRVQIPQVTDYTASIANLLRDDARSHDSGREVRDVDRVKNMFDGIAARLSKTYAQLKEVVPGVNCGKINAASCNDCVRG